MGMDHSLPGPTGEPSEQRTGDLDPPFKRGGRRADLPADYQQRAAADEDWKRQLDRNRRQDREAVGTPKALDGTPWVGKGSGHPRGRDAG